MKLIDKYLFKELVGPFIFAVSAFIAVSIGAAFFVIADLVSKYNASWYLAGQLILLRLPMIFVPVIPMSMLLATLLTFGKLSANSEITAMKSGGLSFQRIMVPVIALGIIVSLASFATSQFVTPWSNKQYDYIEKTLIKKEKAANATVQDNVVLKGPINGDKNNYLVLYAKSYDRIGKTLLGVTVEEFANNKLVRVLASETASYNGEHWQMKNCNIYYLNSPNAFATQALFDLALTKKPELVVADQTDPEQMELGELKAVYDALKSEGSPDYSKFETELFNRSAIPFAGVIFAIIGAPLGMQSNRSSSSVGLGISLVVILLYYAVYSFMLTLGRGGVINGFVAAWSPNIIGMFFGAILIFRARKK